MIVGAVTPMNSRGVADHIARVLRLLPVDEVAGAVALGVVLYEAGTAHRRPVTLPAWFTEGCCCQPVYGPVNDTVVSACRTLADP